MITIEHYEYFVWIWIAIAIIIFVLSLYITAPYGRHVKNTWGPLIDNKIGWIIMELFVLFILFAFVLTGKNQQTIANWIIIGLFSFHYFHRSFIYPFKLRTSGKKMPLSIIGMGLFFNLVNGFIIGYYFGNYKMYGLDWLTSYAFIIGLSIFIIGMMINWRSDFILIHLRKPNETGYKIPYGYMFKYVSCPNLMGETLEWLGFAILTWSLPGFAFFIWTFANLVPRAISHHKWYKSQFPDYPKERKAVIPFLV